MVLAATGAMRGVGFVEVCVATVGAHHRHEIKSAAVENSRDKWTLSKTFCEKPGCIKDDFGRLDFIGVNSPSIHMPVFLSVSPTLKLVMVRTRICRPP